MFFTEHLFCCLVALLKVDFGNLKTILDSHEVVVGSSPEVLLPVACQLGGFVCVFTCVPLHMCGGQRTTLGVSVLISILFGAGSLLHLMPHYTRLARQKASRYSPFPVPRLAPRALGLQMCAIEPSL